MNPNKLIIISLFAVMAIASFPAIAHCQDAVAVNRMESIEGEVSDIDDINQTIVVKWQTSEPDIAYNETTFLVDSSAKIIKGTDEIGFMDINQFDRVTVTYSTNSDLTRKVIRIDVAESD